jgi:hypothetical protein
MSTIVNQKLLIPLTYSGCYDKYTSNKEEFKESLCKIQKDDKISEAVLSLSEASTGSLTVRKFEEVSEIVRDVFEITYAKSCFPNILRGKDLNKHVDYNVLDIYSTDAKSIVGGNFNLNATVPSAVVLNYSSMEILINHFLNINRVFDFIFNQSNVQTIFSWGRERYENSFQFKKNQKHVHVDEWHKMFVNFDPEDLKALNPYSFNNGVIHQPTRKKEEKKKVIFSKKLEENY